MSILKLDFFHAFRYPDAVHFKLEAEPENEYAVQCYEKYGYGRSP